MSNLTEWSWAHNFSRIKALQYRVILGSQLKLYQRIAVHRAVTGQASHDHSHASLTGGCCWGKRHQWPLAVLQHHFCHILPTWTLRCKKKKMLKEVLKSYQPIKTCMSTAGWMDRSPAGEIQYKPILDGSDPNFNSSFFFSVIVFMDIVFLMALSSILYKTAQ